MRSISLLALLFLSSLAFADVEELAPTQFNLGEDSQITDELDPSAIFQPGNIIDVGMRGSKKIALTFDDGPTTGTTEAVLDILQKYGIKAVFFMNGKNIPGREALLRRMFNEGHLLANHSSFHNNLKGSKYDVARTLINDIAATHEKIRPYLRSDDLWLFRAPYGAWKSSRATMLNTNSELRHYIGPVFWNIGGEISKSNGVNYSAADWECWGRGYAANVCLQGYLAETKRQGGGVVLMHDVNMKTAQMVDSYIAKMKAEGYRFVRLDELKVLKKYQ